MPVVYPKDIFFYKRVKKASCFVLMPFDPHFDDVYSGVRNTLQSPELNLICRRADDIRAPNILETILKNIAQSEYVLADLTGSNPNVFYELGIAHCVKNADKVIILAQNMDFVPFDLRHLRCIIYEQSPSGLSALQAELVSTCQHVRMFLVMHFGSELGKASGSFSIKNLSEGITTYLIWNLNVRM